MQISKGQTILLVDDEKDILDFLQYNLEREGYKVFVANDGLEGVAMAQKVSPDLILMDVMMPRMDGIEACQTIRQELQLKTPLIAFLTSRAEDYSQVAGFEAGADDYITKPIRPRLLISKVEALLRRAGRTQANEVSDSTVSIVVNREKFLVTMDNQEYNLPKKEFELIELLASKPGKVFTRDQILSTVWGDETIVGERTIDVHIRKLREKLGESYIRTIKGVGYTFTDK